MSREKGERSGFGYKTVLSGIVSGVGFLSAYPSRIAGTGYRGGYE